MCISNTDTCPYNSVVTTATTSRRNLFEKHVNTHLEQSGDDEGVITLS